MSSARDDVLAHVRAAKRGATAPAIPRGYRHTDEQPHDELVALFCERVDDYKAEVERVHPDRLSEAIMAAATRHGAHRLAIPPELPHDWRSPGLELIADESLTPHRLDGLDGVITGCTVAIAETGTIVLSAAPSEGRRMLSLVPDLHICVVDASQVVGTVPEAISRLGAVVRDERRPVTLISGPSATSDIELQRVEGVHGPRKLVVLVTESTQRTEESASDPFVDADTGLGIDQQ
jgi:L-lactate dehydrogenase complex protein LldG